MAEGLTTPTFRTTEIPKAAGRCPACTADIAPDVA
jgi:hypothetical protein